MLAHKFRLYPNKEQEERLNFTLDMCRQTYNTLLEELNNQVKIDRSAIQHKIVELRQENPLLQQV
ncbi:MAG: helix-turn-helix domain-containing protein, partial [Candidatus Diapherotrites archaeon]|nr:helix-turn-helix domain-containing protein [Candidatus Diapherotrites archaeon]